MKNLMPVKRMHLSDSIDLYELSKVADIYSVGFGGAYAQIIVRSKNTSIKYSIVNTCLSRLVEPTEDLNDWEITLHPYTEDVHVITGLTAKEIIEIVDTSIAEDFIDLGNGDDEPKSYTEPVDDDYKAYLADND
jgi:hypothetical protein|tara:strand:- start:2943 stop:3344 length:402 start_codon:yes stop_codon:yes gene_type:complete